MPELRGPFKRLSLFRHFMQLTRQVEIRTAGVGVSCYASGALISERPFLKRFCAEVHEVTTSRARFARVLSAYGRMNYFKCVSAPTALLSLRHAATCGLPLP